jgi:hypothetical protein
MRRIAGTALAAVVLLGCVVSAAAAAVTPGWECIPTTAGANVTSGGTGATPWCSSGTPVLAPTYEASGVGGKPTVVFSGANVQIVDGSGHTSTVNGTGNLILGYDESPGTQTGSHDLILGEKNKYTRYSDLVDGLSDSATGPYAVTLGFANTSSGNTADVTGGEHNTAKANNSTVSGGEYNLAADAVSSITGGCDNLTGTGTTPSDTCNSTGLESVLGGWRNLATGQMSSVAGGQDNQANGEYAAVAGGCANVSGGNTGLFCSMADGANPGVGSEAILGGEGNFAGPFSAETGFAAAIVGGDVNSAGGTGSAILGGANNTVTGACASIPVTPGSC